MNDRIYRSRDDRVLAGVAAGLADRLDVDATIVRLVWLLLIPLTGAMALLVYIVMAIIVPEEYDGLPGAPWSQTPPAPPAPGGSAGVTGPPPMTRAEWRAQRHAYRVSRVQRIPGAGALIIGSILILVGVAALLNEYMPDLDADRFWPIVLVGLGVVLLLLGVVRHPREPRPGAPDGSVR